MNFTYTCPCGDVMTVDGANKDEAVKKLQDMMTADAVAKHFAEKHVGQPVPPLDQVHLMIAENLMPA